MPEQTGRLEIRLDVVTRHDLEQLARRLNVGRAAAIRIALREACERRRIPPYEEVPADGAQ